MFLYCLNGTFYPFLSRRAFSTMFLIIYIPFFLLFMRSCLLTPASHYSENRGSVFESYEGELDTFDISESARVFRMVSFHWNRTCADIFVERYFPIDCLSYRNLNFKIEIAGCLTRSGASLYSISCSWLLEKFFPTFFYPDICGMKHP